MITCLQELPGLFEFDMALHAFLTMSMYFAHTVLLYCIDIFLPNQVSSDNIPSKKYSKHPLKILPRKHAKLYEKPFQISQQGLPKWPPTSPPNHPKSHLRKSQVRKIRQKKILDLFSIQYCMGAYAVFCRFV